LPWTDKITNENILKQVNEKRKTIKELRNKQSRFIEHILRKGKLENIVTTGKIIGRKDRGRQREKMLDSLTSGTTERQQQNWLNAPEAVNRGETWPRMSIDKALLDDETSIPVTVGLCDDLTIVYPVAHLKMDEAH
jgi:hypothetical protein